MGVGYHLIDKQVASYSLMVVWVLHSLTAF